MKEVDENPYQLRSFVIGGFDIKFYLQTSFFNYFLGFLERNEIELEQTFIGWDKCRPMDVIFDAKTGYLYELTITNSDVFHDLKREMLTENTEVFFRTDSKGITYELNGPHMNKYFLPVNVNNLA